mmetsp:Transcript_104524/g.181507  ORF Transcript_104524/g.181507 Transcript_104524/m.181507 type:complete len:276 (-) Transcript_104524:168-995(-)
MTPVSTLALPSLTHKDAPELSCKRDFPSGSSPFRYSPSCASTTTDGASEKEGSSPDASDREQSFDGSLSPDVSDKPKDAQMLWKVVVGHMQGLAAWQSNFEVLMFQFEVVDKPNVHAMVTFKPELEEASVGIAAHAEELIGRGHFTQLPLVAKDNFHHLFGLANIVWSSVGNGSQLPYRFAVFTYACKSGKHHSRIGGCARKVRCPGLKNVDTPCRMCHEEACILLNNRGLNKRNDRRERKTKRREQSAHMVPGDMIATSKNSSLDLRSAYGYCA